MCFYKKYIFSSLIMCLSIFVGLFAQMTFTSSDFTNNSRLPKDLTREGANKSPAFQWSNIPDGTLSFALTCTDPDAPGGTFVHWIIFNVPAQSSSLKSEIAQSATLSDGSCQGQNDFGTIGYDGACPPVGHGTHRYIFTLYALDTKLSLPAGTTIYKQLTEAMSGHILESATYTGTYSRSAKKVLIKK
jgi:Raf kinase inhibitor-like YbhB/YbcL family protein